MTRQARDVVVWRDAPREIEAMEGHGAFSLAAHGLRAAPYSTAHRRGYVCRYAIEGGRLRLAELEIRLAGATAPPLFGEPPARLTPAGPQVHALYRPSAAWIDFTGWMRVALGREALEEIDFVGGRALATTRRIERPSVPVPDRSAFEAFARMAEKIEAGEDLPPPAPRRPPPPARRVTTVDEDLAALKADPASRAPMDARAREELAGMRDALDARRTRVRIADGVATVELASGAVALPHVRLGRWASGTFEDPESAPQLGLYRRGATLFLESWTEVAERGPSWSKRDVEWYASDDGGRTFAPCAPPEGALELVDRTHHG